MAMLDKRPLARTGDAPGVMVASHDGLENATAMTDLLRPAEATTPAAPATRLPQMSTVLVGAAQVASDALMITAAFALAYYLRFEEEILPVKAAPKPET